MNIFFDTEFTGLQKDTDLISIGLISENNDVFYAEITDYDRQKLNSWLFDNVIKNLSIENFKSATTKFNIEHHRAPFSIISKKLNEWLKRLYDGKKIQFVSDCCWYDQVLLFDLITNRKTALDVPYFISPVVLDICYLIMRMSSKNKRNDYASQISVSLLIRAAFNTDRIRLLKFLNTAYTTHVDVEDMNVILGNCKHNALYDALVIKNLFDILNKANE